MEQANKNMRQFQEEGNSVNRKPLTFTYTPTPNFRFRHVHKALANLDYVSFPPMCVTIHYSTMDISPFHEESRRTDLPHQIFSPKLDLPLQNYQLTQNRSSCTTSLQNQEGRHHHQWHEVLLELMKEGAR